MTKADSPTRISNEYSQWTSWIDQIDAAECTGGSRKWVRGANYGERGEREPIWGSGGFAPVGSRGKAPGQGLGGEAPWS